jgi:hypothetical protein
MKEIELIDLFCDFLEKMEFEFKRELRKGSYHNQGYIDIVIKKGNSYITIEGKVENFTAVLNQALRNRTFFHHSYILYNKLPSKKSIQKVKDDGIGLIILNKDNKFEIIVKSKTSKYFSKYLIDKYIERNWIQNRAGRFFSPNELPPNYDEKKLKKLEPTYDWVGKEFKE